MNVTPKKEKTFSVAASCLILEGILLFGIFVIMCLLISDKKPSKMPQVTAAEKIHGSD